jgi:hypothetical protein
MIRDQVHGFNPKLTSGSDDVLRALGAKTHLVLALSCWLDLAAQYCISPEWLEADSL